jgi:hypothetical protein
MESVVKQYDAVWRTAKEALLAGYGLAKSGNLGVIGAAADTLAAQAFTDRNPARFQAAVDCIDSSALLSHQKTKARAVVDYWAATLAEQLISEGHLENGYAAAQFVTDEGRAQMNAVADRALWGFVSRQAYEGNLIASTAAIIDRGRNQAVINDFLGAQDYYVQKKVVSQVSNGDMAGAYVTAQTFGSTPEIKEQLSAGLPIVDLPQQGVMGQGQGARSRNLIAHLSNSDDFVFACEHLPRIAGAVETLSDEGSTASQLQQIWEGAVNDGLPPRVASRVLKIAQEIQDMGSNVTTGVER